MDSEHQNSISMSNILVQSNGMQHWNMKCNVSAKSMFKLASYYTQPVQNWGICLSRPCFRQWTTNPNVEFILLLHNFNKFLFPKSLKKNAKIINLQWSWNSRQVKFIYNRILWQMAKFKASFNLEVYRKLSS